MKLLDCNALSEIVPLTFSFFHSKFSMALQKYSPVRREANRAIVVATEFGLPLKWPTDGLSGRALLDQKYFVRSYDSEQRKPMYLQQLIPPLILWFTGTIASLLVWILLEIRTISSPRTIESPRFHDGVNNISYYIHVLPATPHQALVL